MQCLFQSAELPGPIYLPADLLPPYLQTALQPPYFLLDRDLLRIFARAVVCIVAHSGAVAVMAESPGVHDLHSE